MSLAAACGWSLARSLLAVAAASFVAHWLSRRLSRLPQRVRPAAWAMLVAPMLFPPLLSGYAYASAGLQLADFIARSESYFPAGLSHWVADQHAVVDEALLWLLLVSRAVPVGTLVLTFAPSPPISDAGLHCRRLAIPAARNPIRRRLALVSVLWHGPWRNSIAAAAIMFLWSFQEFELASLLGRPAWTVWLFDAQAGKLVLSAGAWGTWLPVVCQLLVVAPLYVALIRSRGSSVRRDSGESAPLRSAWRDACYLLAAASLSCGIPLALVGREALRGTWQLAADKTQLAWFARETFSGCLLALVAAGGALGASAWLAKSSSRQRLLLVLCLPGLFGSLLLGLALVKLLQIGWLNPLYRTPWSYLLALLLLLLPRAALLQLVLHANRPESAGYLAELLSLAPDRRRKSAARELQWNLGGAARFWSLGLLTWWGYLDLTVASLLGPATIVSIPVLLYNQMHFGKYATVSAMTCLTVVAPIVLFIAAAAGRHLLFRWLWR